MVAHRVSFGTLPPDLLVADAIVEADPVDPLAASRRIAVAGLHPRGRRRFRSDEAQRHVHRGELAADAAIVPAADHPDPDQHRVAQRRHSGMERRCAEKRGYDCRTDPPETEHRKESIIER